MLSEFLKLAPTGFPFHARLSTWSITLCSLVTSFTWNSGWPGSPCSPYGQKKKKKKGNLDFRTLKHIILKRNLNSGPILNRDTKHWGNQICMIILPTNILHIVAVITMNKADSREREFQRLWSWLLKRRERGLQMWEGG